MPLFWMMKIRGPDPMSEKAEWIPGDTPQSRRGREAFNPSPTRRKSLIEGSGDYSTHHYPDSSVFLVLPHSSSPSLCTSFNVHLDKIVPGALRLLLNKSPATRLDRSLPRPPPRGCSAGAACWPEPHPTVSLWSR